MAEEILEKPASVSSTDSENKDTGEEIAETEDYEALIEKDLQALRANVPGLENISDISELENPVRYGALRDLGLSPEEAYRATTPGSGKHRADNRSHLRSSAPRAIRTNSSEMSYRELETAREIFSGISDAEIQRLYKKVTR